jgi:8-oxo-dGTP pyrophosphatase MutT (NUDIX family)
MTDRWVLLDRKLLHGSEKTGVVRLDRVRVKPSVEREYVIVDSAEIAVVVPIEDDGRIVLVRQFRYAWNATGWECPAGHLDPGETPEQAAVRELEEEAGRRASEVERLLPPFHASARVSARFHAFVARGLVAVPQRPDEDEDVTPAAFSPDEVRALIARGEVLHGPSLLVLFAYLARLDI